ncbi:LysR family transcriptional regulator ArgP [Cellulomonas sp. APG4]|uniref:LysR family transcriptional regulator ArgP n=1 Tax=Cellulomonas sp. APG4 TaxID=1538656 RepID=UPI00137A45AB|nr:LysR family transcriptional regulator ArgP [Cellulomonas sp. APG4]NCT91435.1 LysR family transcriptional regulator ArgP [Cellulomonas sp. APG4]
MDLDPAQLRALAATVATGSLEAAARELHVTPSAVSQRLRGLEVATGRVLLVRSRPVQATASGEVVLRLARQVDAATRDALAELGAEGDGPRTLPVAVNADSLATWVLPALAPFADVASLELHRDDEEHTAELLRSGVVVAAITTDTAPVPGCAVTRLGALRYRPTATPSFVGRWFPQGPTSSALRRAPVVHFDAKDDLQHRYLRTRGVPEHAGPAHHVPSSADFLAAVRSGMGWGMVPELHAGAGLTSGELVTLDPAGVLDVELHWQRWKLRSPLLDELTDALTRAARTHLRPLTPALSHTP